RKRSRLQRVLHDIAAAATDVANGAGHRVSEPEIAVGPAGKANEPLRIGDWKLSNHARGSNAADFLAAPFDKPQVLVRADDHRIGPTRSSWGNAEIGAGKDRLSQAREQNQNETESDKVEPARHKSLL